MRDYRGKMKHVRNIALAAIAVLMGTLYLIPISQVAAVSSSSLSIAPKKEYEIQPGDSVSDKITIKNVDGASKLSLSLSVIDFTYTDNGGTPKLMLDSNAEPTSWSLRDYMKIPKTVTIEPGGSTQVDVDIDIPEGHGAGSYYSAIIYSSGTGEGSGQVGLNASGVTLVFVNIPGKVKESLKAIKLGAYDSDVKSGSLSGYSYFNAKMPDTIGYTLKNEGNVTESPMGTITIRDIFGRTRTINEVNPNGLRALIDQTRTFTVCMQAKDEKVSIGGADVNAKTCENPGLWPGYYRVSLNLFYGQNGNMTQELTKNAGFWYLPWWFVILALAVITALVIFVRRMYNRFHDRFYGPRVKSRRTPARRRK